MKNIKLITFGLIVGFLLGMSVFTFATEQQLIKLVVNGKDIVSDVQPQNINGRVMIPARALAEALGAKVQWNGENNTVNVTSEVQVIEPIKQEPIKPQPIVENPVIKKPIVKEPVSKPIDNSNKTTKDGIKKYEKDGYLFIVKDEVEYCPAIWAEGKFYSKGYWLSYNQETKTIALLYSEDSGKDKSKATTITENIPYEIFEYRTYIKTADYENMIASFVTSP